MAWFKKKKESDFNYIQKSREIKLVLDEKDFSLEKEKISCLILAPEDLVEVVGGKPPYQGYISSFTGVENFYNDFCYLLETGNKK